MRWFLGLFAFLRDERGMATLNVVTKTNIDSTVPEWWAPSIEYEADRKSISGKLSGPEGSDSPIIDKRDLIKKKGDKINFTRIQRLLGKGVSGTTAQEGSEEKQVANVYSVEIELYRHATAFDEIADTESIVDLNATARKQIAAWLERRFDDDWTNRVLNTDTTTTIYGGSKTQRSDLGAGDTLIPRELRRLHTAAMRRGVMPYKNVRGGILPWPVYGACLSEIDYYLLRGDTEYQQDVRFASERGSNNPVFGGAQDMYQGILLYVFSSVSPGDGFLGSYLRPEARVSTLMTAGQTTLAVGPTSAVSNVDYAMYFPTSGSNTLTIKSTLGTEDVTYTGSSSNNPGDSSWATITRAANGTIALAHPAGALVTLKDVGKVLLFGREMLYRGWGKNPEPIKQERDYGMELGVGIKWFYGLKTVVNSDSTAANAVILEVTSPNPNTI